jgi:hypothetical protein
MASKKNRKKTTPRAPNTDERFGLVSSFVRDLILAEEKLLEKTGWTRHFTAGTFSTWTNSQFSVTGANTIFDRDTRLMVYSRNQAILLTKATMRDLGLN